MEETLVTPEPAAPAISIPPVVARRQLATIWLPRIGVLLILTAVAFYAFRAGFQFRHWMWDTTASIRYTADIDRDYTWARTAADEGWLNQYEKMQLEKPDDHENWLDAPPLRLAALTMWGHWSMQHFPKVNQWSKDHSYLLTSPMLRFDLFLEVIGLVSAFLLVRLWAIRARSGLWTDVDSLRWFFRGCIPASIAVLLLWFNPAVVLSAYGWPAWDVWIIPLFLLAAFLASTDWWFTAGVVIGIGAMLKGQQLLAVPVFIIWSLVLLRPLRSIRFVAGFIFAIAIIVSPWMLSFIPADKLLAARALQATFGEPYRVPIGTFKIARDLDVPALLWVCCVLIAAAGLPWVAWLTMELPGTANSPDAQPPPQATPVPLWRRLLASPWAWRAISAMGVLLLVIWPWFIQRNRSNWLVGLQWTVLLMIAVQIIRPRAIAWLSAGATGVALLLCMSLFHGSTGWYTCAFEYPQIHSPWMTADPAANQQTDNLPAVMVADFQWSRHSLRAIAFTIPAEYTWHSTGKARDFTGRLLNLPLQLVYLSWDSLVNAVSWIIHRTYSDAAIEISVGGLLHFLFRFTLLLCSLGLGMHAWRNSSRVLIALTAIWLMYFCLPPQIHERYLVFAAGISCICIGSSVGMTLLGILLSLLSFAMTLTEMMVTNAHNLGSLGKELARQFPKLCNNNSGHQLLQTINGVDGNYPDLGYAIILCTMIFLYFSIAPQRKNPV
jgi:hypothetical protein